MVLPEALQSRTARLSKRLHKLMNSSGEYDEEEDYDQVKRRFLGVLSNICGLVREEAASQSPHLPELVETVQKIIDEGVDYALGESGFEMFDFMPSWAHDNNNGQPLIKDTSEVKLQLSTDATRRLFRAFPEIPKSRLDEMTPDPWNDSMKRHPKSSPLARPRPKLPALTPTAANPVAMSVYDARCEIQSQHISSPVGLCISQGNVCLALNAAGGWKNRSPVLYYRLLGGSEAAARYHIVEPGLADVASHMAIDETRRLIFVGDDERVKSYAWATPGGENYEGKPLPTHTLNCRRIGGPIAVLPNGTVIRAGSGRAAVWELSGLETHGEDGERMIGEEDEDILDDTMRDDSEGIEVSTGSSPSSYIEFTGHSDLSVTGWEPLFQAPATVLCHSGDFDCVTIDLEHGGSVTTRYLGHGGTITDLSVSRGDPQVFLTGCDDGYARLFDLRAPLPILTFDACQQNEACDAVVLAHPDGIPSKYFAFYHAIPALTPAFLAVFTGTGKAEQIKMWDVRARTPVYELATGNNQVESLAWDSDRNCLYAATECSYQDRLGYRHGYRGARRRPIVDSEDEDYNPDDFDGETAWPKNAWHYENYFGCAFDAGNHRIYRHAFKENPDNSIVPQNGDASAKMALWPW